MSGSFASVLCNSSILLCTGILSTISRLLVCAYNPWPKELLHNSIFFLMAQVSSRWSEVRSPDDVFSAILWKHHLHAWGSCLTCRISVENTFLHNNSGSLVSARGQTSARVESSFWSLANCFMLVDKSCSAVNIGLEVCSSSSDRLDCGRSYSGPRISVRRVRSTLEEFGSDNLHLLIVLPAVL